MKSVHIGCFPLYVVCDGVVLGMIGRGDGNGDLGDAFI